MVSEIVENDILSKSSNDMSSYNELIALINGCINRNGVQAITGRVLNGVLRAMVNQLGAGYTMVGVAHPTDYPGTPEAPVCYYASDVGTYTHFGNIQIVPGELALLCFDLTDGWFKETMYEGFESVQATIDGNVGTPAVNVTYVNGVLSFDFSNMKGNTGAAAGFGNVTAAVDGTSGTPGVSVQTDGPDTAKNIAFQFTGLKGETGVTSVIATVDNTSGTPQCAVSLNGQQLTLAFTGLKGAQGDTGSSVAYPFTIVNNLTTNDATQALSAAMGVQLESEVSQLEAKVDGLLVVSYTIEQGAIASATGADSTSTTRLRTNGYVTGVNLRFVPGSGKVMVFAYNESGYIKNTEWLTETTDVNIIGATKYRAVFAKTNDTSITTSDFATLGMNISSNVGNKATNLSEDADVDGEAMFVSVVGENKCNPESITVKSGAYIKRDDGTYKASGSAGAGGVTGYIPVTGKALFCANAFGSSAASWAAYRRATDAELIDSSVTKFIVGNDVVVYAHGGGSTTYKYYQYVSGDIYVRFTLASTSNVMVNEGATSLPFVPYGEIVKTNEDIIGKDIDIDNIKRTEFVYNGRNLCNPSECTLLEHYYVNATNGLITSASSIESTGVTGMIPIDEKGLYFQGSLVSGVNVGYAYYDEHGNYLDGYYSGHTIPGGSPTFAKYITGAKWVVFTINAGVTDVMVCIGNTALPYEAYAGRREVISKDILPDFETEQEEKRTMLDGVEIVLPSEIVITQTDRLQIFFRDIITAYNPYNFAVECICSVGKPMPRCFELVPTASNVGKSYTLSVRIYDNAHRLVSSASTTIKVVANATSPGSQKNILLIGASTLYDGTIAKEVSRRFTKVTGDGTYYNPTGLGLSNIALVGRTTTSDPSVNQESQSGWQWKDYATSGRSAYRFFVTNIGSYDLREGAVYSGEGTLKFTITEINLADGYFSCTYEGSGTQPASGTLTKYSGDGSDSVAYDSFNIDSRNPFWDNVNDELDFTSYITDYCGGQLDVLVSYLGINDLFQSRTPAETITNYVIPFLRALHTQSPSTKVVLCNLHIPSPDGGMGKTYGATERTYWGLSAKYYDYIMGLNELVADAEFSSWVSIASTFQEFDADNLYPTTNTRTICNRSEATETTQSDGVHPTANGKKAIADSIYHKITQLL